MAERLTLREYLAGTAVLVATGSERLSLSEHATGITTNLGVSKESLVFKEDAFGMFQGVGFSKETLSFSEYAIGTVTIKAIPKEALSFSEFATASLWGNNKESLSFSEYAVARSLITGTSRESISFAEKLRGAMVETTDGIWCINLAHGGHSRYTGDISGVTPVSAYAITGSSQLGSDRTKYVHDAFVHLRCDGDMELTTTTDEQKQPDPYTICSDDREGMHRRRVKLSKGIKGTNWQVKIANVAGTSFTLKTVELKPVASQRVQ